MMERVRTSDHIKMAGIKGQVFGISDSKDRRRSVITSAAELVPGLVNHIRGHVQAGYLHIQSHGYTLGQKRPRSATYIQHAEGGFGLGGPFANLCQHQFAGWPKDYKIED